jgi:hypothetical protein
MSTIGETAAGVLDFLHGAREFPPENAAAGLREFVDSLSASNDQSVRLTEARDALRELVHALETEKAASDDTWQKAIQTTVTLANEAI